MRLIDENDAPAGFSNDYVLSKRNCEQLVLESSMDAVVLRPSIVLSHGVRSPEFARSILWVLPVMRRLGVLPLTGDEPIDAVSVGFVAESVVQMLSRDLRYRIYHLSAGPEASVTLNVVVENGQSITNRLNYLQIYCYNLDPDSLDSDGDTLNDYDELFVLGIDPRSRDTDKDGMDDKWETQYGFNPPAG